MVAFYNPYDWYWIVNADESRFWSSKSSAYVTNLPDDAGVTKIDSEQNLSEVLVRYGLNGPVPVVPASIPLWAARVVLQQSGMLDQANAAITASGNTALIAVWEYGNYIERSSLSIETLGAALGGLTYAQIDQLFIDAGNLTV
jgi:hypothetical protein